jgi:hypothetical protein
VTINKKDKVTLIKFGEIMTIPTFDGVGFCAHYSKQGDWAFDFALRISKAHNVKLNVFFFLKDPYDPNDTVPPRLSRLKLKKLAIAEEKKLRLYYDYRSGEYLNVGFRVCYDDSWTELHKCLMVREFQLLVLGYTKNGVIFAKKPIEEFANNFISPVILVGPDDPTQFYLNHQAKLLSFKLGISNEKTRYE